MSTVALDGTGYRAVASIYAGGGAPDGAADESSNVRVEWKDATTLAWPRSNGDGTWSAVTAPDAANAAAQAIVTCAGSAPHHLAFAASGAVVAAFSPAAGAPVDLFAIDPSSAACATKKNLSALAGATSRAHDFAVSPDGASIAFLRWDGTNDAGSDPNNEGDLYVVPADGSAPATAIGAPTAGRIGPRFIAGGTRLAWTRVAPPLAGPDGGDPRYAEAVAVLLTDGGSPFDIAVGNGADTIVAGVGPGGSCAAAPGPASNRGAPAAFGAMAIAIAAIVTRRRRSRSEACARPAVRPSTRAARPTRATGSGAPPRS